MNEIHDSNIIRRPHLTKEQRLPKCYKEVEKIVKSVKSCQINFKTALAKSRLRGPYIKKTYKLSLNVLKYYNYIKKIIDKSELLKKEKFLREEIAAILIYELIFGNGTLPGESKAVTAVRMYQNDLMTAHQELQDSNEDFGELNEVYVPRYARVHTLVTTVACVIKDLQNCGFNQILYDADLSEEKFYQLVKSLEKSNFLIDFHFKDMLVFSQAENLIYLDLYKNGHIFLQDKASYIPVHALNPEPGTTVLDACAAPGMKTAHIASKMKNKGILIACERDKTRFETLKETLKYGSVKISRTLCTDFKLIDPNDEAYSAVDYILLDPSCSGSGMVNRMDNITDTETSKTKERLFKLAGFQIILLKHALKFPSVKRVVYSTCSVHEEENEYVVQEALNTFGSSFKLVPVLPGCFDRGTESYNIGKMCLRTVAEKHLTNGFFVAMFERIESYEHKRKNFSGKHSKRESEKKSEEIFPETADTDSINLKTWAAQQPSSLDSLDMTSGKVQDCDQENSDIIHLNLKKRKDFKTPEYSKHIKKEKGYIKDIQFSSIEQGQEVSNSALQEQCENSDVSLKIETIDQSSNVSISEKKTKHKRHLISDSSFENFGMDNEMSLVKLKHKKRKKEIDHSNTVVQHCSNSDVWEQNPEDYQSSNQDAIILDSFSPDNKQQIASKSLKEKGKESKYKSKHNKQEMSKATFSKSQQNSENSFKSISSLYSGNEVVDNETNFKEQPSKNDFEIIGNCKILEDSALKQKKKKRKKNHSFEEGGNEAVDNETNFKDQPSKNDFEVIGNYKIIEVSALKQKKKKNRSFEEDVNIESINLPFSGNEVVDNKTKYKNQLSRNDSEIRGSCKIYDVNNLKKSKKKYSLEENISIYANETGHTNETNSLQNEPEKIKESFKFKQTGKMSNYLENNCLKEDKSPSYTPIKEYKKHINNSDFTPSEFDSLLVSGFVKSPSNLLSSSENSIHVSQNEGTEKQFLTDNYLRCKKSKKHKKHASKSTESDCTVVFSNKIQNCISSDMTNNETNQTVFLHPKEISIISTDQHHHKNKKSKKHEKDKEYDSSNFQFSNTKELQINQDFEKNIVQNDVQLIVTPTENDCVTRKKRKKSKMYLADDTHFTGNNVEEKKVPEDVSIIEINPKVRSKNCKKIKEHYTEIELHNIPLPKEPDNISSNRSKKKKKDKKEKVDGLIL